MGRYAGFWLEVRPGTGREWKGTGYLRFWLMRPPILRCAIALTFSGVAACASSSPAPAPSTPLDTIVVQGPVTVDASTNIDVAASQPQASSYVGSPLCNAGPQSVCYPDNLASDPTTAENCHTAPDGGAYDPDGGYADAGLACHIASSDAGPQPQCSTSGPNQEGASCHLSSDCAVGDECVGDPGVCRHYCCSGVGVCDSTQFCDIRPEAEDPSTGVPVCVPLRPCGLIDEWSDAGECPAMETCAVARVETGATSCVPTGAASEGESCKTEHCAAGLVCLGPTCFKLCHTAAANECSASQACKAALPVFPNPLVGVCETVLDSGY